MRSILGSIFAPPPPLPVLPQGIIPCQKTKAATAKSLSAVSWLATDLFDLRFRVSRNRLGGKLVIVGVGGLFLALNCKCSSSFHFPSSLCNPPCNPFISKQIQAAKQDFLRRVDVLC